MIDLELRSFGLQIGSLMSSSYMRLLPESDSLEPLVYWR